MVASANIRVLVAEISPEREQTLMGALAEAGVTVLGWAAASDALGKENVLTAARLHQPDAVLLDLDLIAERGWELVDALHAAGVAPLMAIFLNVPPELFPTAVKAGVGALVSWPPRPGELELAVQVARVRFDEMASLRLAQEDLRLNEQKLSALLSYSSDVVSVIDQQGRLLYCSASIERIFGYSARELLNTDILNLIHPEDNLKVKRKFFALLENPGQTQVTQFRFLSKNRGYVLVEVVGNNHLNDPAVHGLVLNFRDISERCQTEQALIESEERFRQLFNEMLDGFALHEIICNEQGVPIDYRFLQVNPAYERLTGLKGENLIGHTVLEAIPTLEMSWIENFGKVALTGNPVHLEDYVQALDRYYEVIAFCPQRGRFATIFTDITERKHSERQALRQLETLKALRSIDSAITGSLNLHQVLGIFVQIAMRQLHVDAVDVLKLTSDFETMELTAAQGFRTRKVSLMLVSLRDELVRQVSLGKFVRLPDLPAFSLGERGELFAQEGFIDYYGVPLVVNGQLIGVFEVFNRSPIKPNTEWLNLLETLGGQVAVAVQNSDLFEGLQRHNYELTRAYDETIEGWSRALDLRDQETEGHSERVTELTLRLARRMGIQGDALAHIQRGALLHDIGKVGIPDHVLLKPGQLTADEWSVMRQHPIYGYELLLPIQFLRPAIDIPYCHHEKWDGTGYPRRLKSNQIPLSARIFSVVDVWDALTSNRPYRKAWPHQDVLEYIRSQVGKHFDPRVVSDFMKIIKE